MGLWALTCGCVREGCGLAMMLGPSKGCGGAVPRGAVPRSAASSVSRALHFRVRRESLLTASERSEALSALGLEGVRGGEALDARGQHSQRGQKEVAEAAQGGRAARLLSIVLSRSSCVEIRRRRRTSTALWDSLRIAVGDTSAFPRRSMPPPLPFAAAVSGSNWPGRGAPPLGMAPWSMEYAYIACCCESYAPGPFA